MATVTSQDDIKNAAVPNRFIGLWRLISGFRWTYFLATTSLGIAALSKTATYLLLRYFVDQILGQTNSGSFSAEAARRLPLVALGFVGLALFEGGFTFLSGKLAAQTAEGVTLRLRNYLFDHIQRMSFTYHDQTKTGELIQRSTSDVDALRRFFSDQAIGVGRIILLFSINLIALLQLNTRLALLSIVVIPAVIVLSLYFFRRVTKAYEAYQEQDAVVTTTLQENLTGVRVVKAFARQSYERDKFEIANFEKYQRGRHLLLMHALFWPFSDILCGAQLLAGFTAGAIMTINGEISVGTYLAYAGLVVWLIFPMRNLGRLIVQASTGLVSLGRVMEIVKQDREPFDDGSYRPEGNVRGEIIFEDISFGYGTDNPILAGISFTCKPGQSVALLGSTGSGKTSLVNLLPRFYEYSHGRILLDEVELNQYSRQYLRRQIGIVEQEPFLFSRSIRENITYGVGRQVSQDEIESAARSAAIHDVILSFPEGYNTLLGEKGVTLSGGQKQRIAIARTLLKDPRILILDDSTSSVDTETEAAIRFALAKLMHGRTSFVIAHRIQSVMNADLILVLERGRIAQRGTHTQLMAEPGIYREIYDLQTLIDSELEQEVEQAESTWRFLNRVP